MKNKILENKVTLLLAFLVIVLVIIFVMILLPEPKYIYLLSSEYNKPYIEIKNPDMSCVLYKTFYINGSSMAPLLKNGDKIEVFENYGRCNEILRGSVAILTNSSNDNPLIKSVKGVPGDSFVINKVDGGYTVSINGEKITNSDGKIYRISGKRYDMLKLYEEDYNQKIPANSYLVLSDSGKGKDSTKYGLINRANILGIVKKN